MTTVASWEPTEQVPTIDGVRYTGKSTEFLRCRNLPSRSDISLEVAMSGPAPNATLRAEGWNIIDAWDVTSDPWVYRGYLANSFAEFSVAKNAYATGRTGWFSCRSACYIELGVTFVLLDTGYVRTSPSIEGLHTIT